MTTDTRPIKLDDSMLALNTIDAQQYVEDLDAQLAAAEAELGALHQQAAPTQQQQIELLWQRTQWFVNSAKENALKHTAMSELAKTFKHQRDQLLKDLSSYAPESQEVRQLIGRVQADYHELVYEGINYTIMECAELDWADADLLTDLLMSNSFFLAETYSLQQINHFRAGIQKLLNEVRDLPGIDHEDAELYDPESEE